MARFTRPVFGRLKPLLIVRTPREFYLKYAQWAAIYFAAFFFVHLVWRWRRFRGDPAILPALHLLTGIGLILAVSLRDPLRDTLEFSKFAWGVAAGCCLLLLPLLRAFHYQRFSRLDLHATVPGLRAICPAAAVRLGTRRAAMRG